MRRDTIIEFNLESINLIYVDEIQYVYNNTEVSETIKQSVVEKEEEEKKNNTYINQIES